MIAPPPGLEQAMVIDRPMRSHRKETVTKFYKDMWDHADVSLIPEIFYPDFTFRGSLGPQLLGYAQFADYVRWVTEALENYTSDILGLIEEGDAVSGRIRFHGIHRGPLFGQAPTGRHVWWYGAPVFTFEGGRVRDLWVLGDIHGLIGRIAEDAVDQHEFATVS